ncbi:MAG: Phytoene desaturase (lycopene-forming) [Candidatus Heimdallarchaeota archaeon LC_2]|nr:MAG: Phytoene desaturase (lycopene-forming) [Candidatus Heimdallarchaeota archaeon LC_2]
MENYDAIIIGAGLGGLSCGAKLAKEGKKILMVEQHNIVGGCATAFNRKRTMRFEVGLHEMNGLNEPQKQKMLKDVGIWDKVDFIRVPEFYRVIKGDLDIVVPDDIDGAKAALIANFPKESNAINQYFKDITGIRKQTYRYRWGKKKKMFLAPLMPLFLSKLIKFRKTTIGDYLDSITENEDLKLTIIANLGYYHDDPYALSMLFFASGNASYMGAGGWFVKGGSQKLSDAFAEVIEENGGKIILKHCVEEIIVENNKAVGIKYIRNKRTDPEELTSYAGIIIANAAMPNVFNHLIPSLKDSTAAKIVNELEPGCSLFSIYYSFSKPVNDLFEGRYSTFLYDENITKISEFHEIESSGDYDRKGMVFVNYNAIDSEILSDENYTGVLCGIDYLKNWEDLEHGPYKEKKQQVIDTYTKRLDKQFPGFADLVQYSEMATPSTIKRYTQNPHGTVYGFAPTPEQALKNKVNLFDNNIENLYFASAWVFAGGFSGAISAGYSCANAILRKKE